MTIQIKVTLGNLQNIYLLQSILEFYNSFPKLGKENLWLLDTKKLQFQPAWP